MISKDVENKPALDGQKEEEACDATQQQELKQHVCEECGLAYTWRHALQRHIALAHRDEFAFSCEFCNFRGQDLAGFRQHMARHFHLKSVACEVCLFFYGLLLFFA